MNLATGISDYWRRVAVGLLVVLPAVVLVTYIPLRGEGVTQVYWALMLVAAVVGFVFGLRRLAPDILQENPSSAAAVAVAVPVAAVLPVVLGVGVVGLVTGPVFIFLDLAFVAASLRAGVAHEHEREYLHVH